MRKVFRSRRAGVAVALAALVLVVSAAAHARMARRSLAGHPVAAAVVSTLGISPQQLRSDLRSGQTLGEIAAASGKPVGVLEQAISSAVTTRLDRAVAAGRLSSQAEQTILSRLPARIDALVGVKHPVAHVLLARRIRLAVARFTATYLNLTPRELRTELRSGKTLAQIAVAQGKTAADLEAAIQAAAQKRLDAAVTAGRLDSTREATLLSALQKRLDAAMNSSFGR